MDSGGIYKGVPTLIESIKVFLPFTANPKSAILSVLPDLRIFAGLRSLWRTPFWTRYLQPEIICYMI